MTMKVSTPQLAYVCSGLHTAKKFNINTIDWNYQIEIVTLHHEPNGPSSFKDAAVMNMYSYFKGPEPKKVKIKHPIEQEGLTYIQESNKPIYRYYDNGRYIKYQRFTATGELAVIDYFNENRQRFKREEYDLSGYVHSLIYMDLETNKPKQHLYLRKDGTCYMTKWYKNNGTTEKIIIFDEKDNIVKVLSSENELYYEFLSRLIKEKEYLFLTSEVGVYKTLKSLSAEYSSIYLGFMETDEILDNPEKEISCLHAFVAPSLKRYHDTIEKTGPRTTIYNVSEGSFTWKGFVDKLIDQVPFHNQLKDMHVKLSAAEWQSKSDLYLSAEVDFKGGVPAHSVGRYHMYWKLKNKKSGTENTFNANVNSEEELIFTVSGTLHVLSVVDQLSALELYLCCEWDNSFFASSVEVTDPKKLPAAEQSISGWRLKLEEEKNHLCVHTAEGFRRKLMKRLFAKK
ncbi:alpha-glucosyltransferase N-terminal domain-containing protein [Bacillus vallismortis]|uniref:alpha-glucosyltransferase N-terminal domain-containing protein n=1 Tax=Bacillus vallismortis TaxID=72361 RepID=UPI000EF54606|nr:alpha-glucosyltransferase N-terminal domain-containing protein [Bacillus vallismortis]